MTVLTKHQTETFRADYYVDKKAETLVAKIRYDDECNNGHNTFSITGNIYQPYRQHGEPTIKHKDGATLWLNCGGCVHDEIAKHLPKLAKYIKWHLCSSDEPLHYIANTLFHAGDKDCWGRRAGEPCAWDCAIRFGDSPVSHHIPDKFWKFLKERQGTGDFQVAAIAYVQDKGKQYDFGPKYTFVGFADKWHDCPFDSKVEADEFCEGMNRCKVEFVKLATDFSKGKERDLNAARNCAIWPEATDEELTAPDLEEKLKARHPALMAEFRAAVEELGFIY